MLLCFLSQVSKDINYNIMLNVTKSIDQLNIYYVCK